MHRLRNIGDCFDWIANFCSILTFRRPGWLGEEKLLYEASATVYDHVLERAFPRTAPRGSLGERLGLAAARSSALNVSEFASRLLEVAL